MSTKKRPSIGAGGTPDQATAALNASGFLFQLRVEEEVKAGRDRHAWAVAAREHPWDHEKSGRSGFADLVLTNGGMARFVVECKRSRQAHWYFIVPSDAQETVRNSAIYWIDDVKDKGQRLGWGPLQIIPTTFQSTFCIVRGSGENDQPLLERIGASLVDSVEAIAREEVLHVRGLGRISQLLYVPLLVTNATLHVVRCDLPSVSLATGDIETAETVEVPYLRFRKALSHRFAWPSRVAALRDISEARQRTLFVVNAASLTKFLTTFADAQGWDDPPWKMASMANAAFSNDLWP